VQLSVKETPLPDFLRLLCSQHGVSVVWSDNLDKRLVSLEADGVPVDEIFEGLARRFGVAVERVGASWYVGDFRDEDKANYIRKVGRLSAKDARLALKVVLSDSGRAEVFEDGLIVACDRAGALRRLSSALDDIENAPSGSWVLQLYLVSTSKSATTDLGLDTTALIDISYTLAKDSLIPFPSDGVHLASKLSAVLHATSARDDVRMVGRPLFVLTDGQAANFTSGLSVPVPRKTVSNEGTVTTSGFDYIQSGITASATVRDGGAGLANLELKISLGQITGYVEGAPIQARDEFSTVCVVASSGVYLLGALDRDESRNAGAGLHEKVLTRKQTDKRESQIQVWARLYRIGGAL